MGIVPLPNLKEADGNRRWYVSTPATTLPVTRDELKLFARIDGDAEDSLLDDLLEAATAAAEGWLGRSLIEQTITMTLDTWPTNVVRLPMPPLISVTSVVILDEDDTETAFSSDYYYVLSRVEEGELIVKRNYAYPVNQSRDFAGFRIIYQAGYGASATSVPRAIREGILFWAARAYESRQVGTTPPPEAKDKLRLYKRWQI